VVFDAAFLVAAVAAPLLVDLLTVSLGSFLGSATTALNWAPARNFGTAVFLARLRSPVRGLRTIRASRTCRSKAPNPVMATFSALAT
jgi:hypothetical protein